MKTKIILPLLTILLFACSEEKTSTETAKITKEPSIELVQEEPVIEVSTKPIEECEPKPEKIALPKKSSYSFSSVVDFYKANEAKAETFSISADVDTVIKGAKGTEILVRKNCFVDKNGNAVTEPVVIELKEFYSMEDFIFNSMHSTSKGKLLETGGMFHITASADGNEVFLREGQSLSIKIPTEEVKEGMQYFKGIETDYGLDWVASGNSNNDFNCILTSTRRIVVYETKTGERFTENSYLSSKYGALKPKCKECDSYFKRTIKFPVNENQERVSGPVNAAITLGKDGSVISLNVKGPNRITEKVVEDAIQSYSSWTPPISNGELQPTVIRLSFRFEYNYQIGKFEVVHPDYAYQFDIVDEENYLSAEAELKEHLKKRQQFESEMNQESGQTVKNFYKNQASNYILEATQLGFINCDRFSQYPRSNLTNITVKADGNNPDIKLIFKNIRSVMQGYSKGNGEYQFVNIPVGEPITILGIKDENGSPQFAFKKTKIERAGEVDLEYSSITYKELKDQIARLN